jgi:ApaG protein
MITATTKGVRVSVETFYNEKVSNDIKQFVFAYRVTIENCRPESQHKGIQLLSRSWHIVNAFRHIRQVKGIGVIGKQPVIRPNQKYLYVSSTSFNTAIGKMFGHFVMKNLHDGTIFEVEIPTFVMIAPHKLN